MNTLSPNLYIATLGPLAELLGIVVVIGIFTLLRGQADRHPYFKAWEVAFVFFAVSLTAGLFYDRFVDATSVFYPASTITTRALAIAFLAFRLLSMAMFVSGAQLYARGSITKWLPRVAIPLAVALAFLVDTTRTPLAPLRMLHGPIATLAFVYCAQLFGTLPRSRRSVGTRFATAAFVFLAALAASLAAFYVLQLTGAAITGNPWLVRFARYSFFIDLSLRLLLSWAMIRLLTEDTNREAADTRAHLRLVHDRDKLGDLYDVNARLLGRRAFEAFVGLDFARASFGSVAHVRISNFARVAQEHGPETAEALVVNVAGVLDSAVRAHDRVFRWGPDEILIVMPRAVAGVARSRVEFLVGRVAPLTLARGGSLRAETAVAVQFFRGGEDLTAAAAKASAG